MLSLLQVTVLNTTHDYFDYLSPEQDIDIGCRVWVTLRGKKSLGLVTGKTKKSPVTYTLQPIDEVIDETPIIDDKMLSLMHWSAQYYQSPLSEALKNILPKYLREGKPFEEPKTKKSTASPPPFSKPPALTLNQEQGDAIARIKQSLDEFIAFLLFGITGSGKTEVYFQIMEDVLTQHKQILLLVPEIALTPQLLSRIEKRFDYPIALMHSKLTDKARFTHWFSSHQNKARILIGTRSAVFTPLPTLGLIIIDEEHDLSFKQQDSMRYSARDIAIKRAHQLHIPIVLGSATPALETLHNALHNKYELLRLTQRAKTKKNNHFSIIDLRNKTLTDGLCEPTLTKIASVLHEKKQVLVFINRRGYSPVLICHQCAWIADCPRCTAHLTVHFQKKVMQCHHCDYKRPLPNTCEHCASMDLVPVGAGTERITQYLTTRFPDAKVLRIDKDSTRKKGSLTDTLKSIDAGEADILVGTQMLAKGHHFPYLKLVVIVDADGGFYSQDFRALERLGQTLTQVSGRAGREDQGEVFIQTHQPDNAFLALLIQQGYADFSKAILKERKIYDLPPFSFLALLRTKGKNPATLMVFLNALKTFLVRLDNSLTLLGPAPAPMEKKANFYHAQLLIKASKRMSLSLALKELREMVEQNKVLKRVRFTIDVDCQDLS